MDHERWISLAETNAEARHHVAIVKVSHDLLLEALHLPRETVLKAVRDQHLVGQVELLVEHPDLKAVCEGHSIPPANPRFRRCYETGKVEFLDWGQ